MKKAERIIWNSFNILYIKILYGIHLLILKQTRQINTIRLINIHFSPVLGVHLSINTFWLTAEQRLTLIRLQTPMSGEYKASYVFY